MKLLKSLVLGFIGISIFLTSCSQSSFNVDLKTDLDTMSYAIGINMAANLKRGEIEEINIEAFAKGLKDAYDEKEGAMTNEEAIDFLNNYFTKIQEVKAKAALEEGEKFLAENAKQEGVVVDSTGLQYKVIEEGTGPMPTPEDMVKVHYRGTLIDGTEFDSSYGKDPAQFQLNRVIKGWTIGLQKMKVGAKYMFYIPAELGYGANPRPGGAIKPNSVLIFEVELLDIVKE
ncbi:MAG TPA: FKBP-type peptidyl-prolyl cis-trans isomerase [Tenuifilaceae bacterium]|nr:FKBP-type peptidyl-prolyl cis-trans isomerase [Tenuifilaceae bacterium]HPE19428.1 FKBP-type peptidyl-prolyl cis-trans isomerase [Tenuifilaceae bacterium]HPJ46779.1 FKBP-type peptidyl-prolyl cis-trans isomerase [Tenuifilaceae bacterium]HPQ35472.1 FKBP-type peptidyl-prolyl cis-trans isomerase [Tenuifilaceae bacterium]HRX68431.1 FKBP-type peptidyl-prolyl cis-trans isomerase [Tenuifilaceae bacterium]